MSQFFQAWLNLEALRQHGRHHLYLLGLWTEASCIHGAWVGGAKSDSDAMGSYGNYGILSDSL